jgi:hypothetical protein
MEGPSVEPDSCGGRQMPGFTVVHADGMTKDSEFREYERLLSRDLLKRKVNLAEVPRVKEPGTGNAWLYVWPGQEEANDFATRLNKQTRTSDWVVQPLREGTSPSIGPLRPIEIQVGWQRNGYTFALAPWTHWAIQTLFPGACRVNSIFVDADVKDDPASIRADVERFARQALLMLTELDADELRGFESYVVKDPVTNQTLVSPSRIGP